MDKIVVQKLRPKRSVSVMQDTLALIDDLADLTGRRRHEVIDLAVRELDTRLVVEGEERKA
jgi:hypothetical protein